MTVRWAFDLARKYFPDKSNEELSDLLWTLTSYPCGDVECIEKQLVEIKRVMEVTDAK